MTGDQRRLEIFRKYAANWTIVHPRFGWTASIPATHHEAVLCPLCLTIFNASSLDQNFENPLTLEHIPPSQLGGKPKILTCKKCNNESGRLLDHNIAQYIKNEPFMRLDDGSEIMGTTSFKHSNGKEINSRTLIKIGKDNTFIFKAQIEKGEWREEQLKNIDTKAPISINFDFSTPSLRRVHVAFLRIAYLLAFEKFGHAFILNEMYNGLRHQMLEPDTETLEPFGSMLATSLKVSDGIYATTTPFGLKCFLVVFTLKMKEDVKKACVFLPSPFTDSVTFYKKFKELPSQKFTVDTSERFLDLDFLADKTCAFAFKNPFRAT